MSQRVTSLSPYTLVIGDKNLSSWSLRPWLLMRHAGIPFDEVKIALDQPDTQRGIREHSPAGRVPVLRAGALTIWDSLAICEFVAETHPECALWPERDEDRAVARSVCAEMHAGFPDLRDELPMEVMATHPGRGFSTAAQADIDRVCEIWRDCRESHGQSGPFLFGRFSVADAMYAPVVSRFRTYCVPLDNAGRNYCDRIWSLPAITEWCDGARREVSNPER